MATTDKTYDNCVVTPMSENGDGKPLFKTVHIVDALIVGGIVFFSLLLGASLPQLFSGGVVYVGIGEVANRLVTAILAFGLTFFAQWARYRGIKIMKLFNQ